MRDSADCSVTYCGIISINRAAQKLVEESAIAVEHANKGEGLAAIGVMSSIEEDAKALAAAIEGIVRLQRLMHTR